MRSLRQWFYLVVLASIIAPPICHGQIVADSSGTSPVPVVLDGDTLLLVTSGLGPFSASQRASAIEQRLAEVVRRNLDPSLLQVDDTQGYSTLILADVTIMAVTEQDGSFYSANKKDLATYYAEVIRTALRRVEHTYNYKRILTSIATALLLVLGAMLLFFAFRWLFPRLYTKLESWEGSVFRPIRFRSHEIVSPAGQSAFFIVGLKGVRLIITLAVLYFIITYSLSLFPWTAGWNVKPVLIDLFLVILTTAAGFVAFRGVNRFFRMVVRRIHRWRGSFIKSIKLKNLEVLSEERLAGMIQGFVKICRLVALVALAYFYVTVVFSFFDFTKTWAGTLVSYVVGPLWSVIGAFIAYLPSLFFILVIVFVTRFVLKFIRLVFAEVGRGAITVPGFYTDWAEPTYKIVRFLVMAFAAVVIFPYLPGSSSPVFQGISVFLGILLSLGSTSAVANVVAGVVLTYMRPFKIGDRVKIADTTGDVIEKTLLVTRVRTIKNADITIPNSMVLGSHIINFSSSAQEPGLILHTGVTIGYDVEWKTVHRLLLAAAGQTGDLLKEPKPFILQTSLNDFSVTYELNAYTNKPNETARLYSELHANIQDQFNGAGVEILSPHYSAVRDGNKTTVPDQYLPSSYQAPGFRFFPSSSKPDINKEPDTK